MGKKKGGETVMEVSERKANLERARDWLEVPIYAGERDYPLTKGHSERRDNK